MNYQEFADAIDGLWAYDTGCTDSGTKDEALRMRVKWVLATADGMPWLTKFAHGLTAEGSPYSLEDVASLIRWLSDFMEYDV